MFPQIQSYLKSIIADFQSIPTARQQQLKELAKFLQDELKTRKKVSLNFICTHNSRRSHFGQVWAAIAAAYYHISNIHTYSGGTEATAFNPRSVAALRRVGLEVKTQNNESPNPKYHVSFSDAIPPMICFSKTYDASSNPSNDFTAIMTCNHADENCPIVFGASKRFAITYEDPKVADDTPQEVAKYDERCRQIATEMFYVFSMV